MSKPGFLADVRALSMGNPMKGARGFAALLGVLLITALLAELALRGLMTLMPAQFQRPELFANSFCEDEYWLLYRYFEHGEIIDPFPETKPWTPVRQGELPPNNFVRDAQLGYTFMRNADTNPYGSLRPDDQTHRQTRKILFFGDSFLAGMEVAVDDSITAQIEAALPGYEVHNFGVPGYGLGQIYLRALRLAQELPGAPIVLMIFDDDLDRMHLSYRGSPKPRLGLDATGNLTAEPPPPLSELQGKLPLSYVWRLGKNTLASHAYPCRPDRSRGIVRALYSELDAALSDRPWGVLLMSLQHDANTELLEQEARAQGIPVVNATRIMQEQGVYERYGEYFSATNHPTAVGNERIAQIALQHLLTGDFLSNPRSAAQAAVN